MTDSDPEWSTDRICRSAIMNCVIPELGLCLKLIDGKWTDDEGNTYVLTTDSAELIVKGKQA